MPARDKKRSSRREHFDVNGERIFYLILPAKDIPEGATVLKRTGSYEHILTRKIVIYGEKVEGKASSKKIIEAHDESVFLVDNQDHHASTFNAYSEDTEFIWVCSLYDLEKFLAPVSK